jgi:hypothetical protein
VLLSVKTREDYDRAIVLTRELMHAWDPGKLLAGGAPRDEFDDEVARLVARIPRIADAEDAGRHVGEVFSAQFGLGVVDAAESARIGARWYAALVEAGLARQAT